MLLNALAVQKETKRVASICLVFFILKNLIS